MWKNKLKIGGVIASLLISTTSYGEEVLKNNNNNKIITVEDGNGLNLKYTNIFTNNGVVSASNSKKGFNDPGDVNKGNGVIGQNFILIKNNGIIQGRDDTSNFNAVQVGNGIVSNNIQEIINNGIISGEAFVYYNEMTQEGDSGNGILNINSNKNSEINLLSNLGIIQGISSNLSLQSGNGIFNNGVTATLGEINNSGIIQGKTLRPSSMGYKYSGNGIYNKGENSIINKIINNGLIQGATLGDHPGSLSESGNGIINIETSSANIGDISNSGIIRGIYIGPSFSQDYNFLGNGIVSNSIKNILNSGIIASYGNTIQNINNGIMGNNIGNITNNGIVKGNNSAINGSYTTLANNGILAGTIITNKNTDFINNGITVELSTDNSGNISKVTNGKGGLFTENNIEKTIINGAVTGIDSSLNSDTLKSTNNLIINGIGTEKGALVINSNLSLENSTVNGYNTAVYLEGNNKLVATKSIFNGGGSGIVNKNETSSFIEYKDVIKGDNRNNSISLNNKSIINGNVDLGGGDDTLTFDNTTQINGTLNGGNSNEINGDTLNLGVNNTFAQSSQNLNILHNISNFENINTNGNVTLFENAEVTDAKNINLESGKLSLRIDPTKTLNEKIIGHALYNNTGNITSKDGKLEFKINGLGENAIISMNNTLIDKNMNTTNPNTDKIITDSSVLDAIILENGDILISVDERLAQLIPDNLLYKKLNKVYQSILSSGELGNLANTTLLDGKTENESLGQLFVILDQIYANNPYAYTLKSSRDSLKIFENNMSYLTISPKANQWLVQGKAIYTGVKNDNDASGKNYYGFDTGHRNYKTTTNTVGGLATFEYGLSDKASLGIVFGGNNQDINFKGTSSIDGNSLYLGTFAKTEKSNFKFMTGLGYQYTSNDVDRSVSNQYDSFKTDEKYDVNSLNAFIEGKYSMNIDNQVIMEPKIRLSYYYVDQDKIDEGYTPGQISMKAGKVTSSTGDLEIGIDFKKNILLNNDKLNSIISIGIINTIGEKEKSLHGNIIGKDKNGTSFDIKGVELPRTSGKIAYNLELEKTNGIIYSTGINLEFAKDNNRNLNITAGMGYKF